MILLFACTLLTIANGYTYEVNYTSLDTTYHDRVGRNETHTFVFVSKPGTLRMTASLVNTATNPLFIYIQYRDIVQSLTLPIRYESYSLISLVNRTARTICLDKAGVSIRVWFESNSIAPVSYSFSLATAPSNILQLDTPYLTLISPSEPNFFSYLIDTDNFDIILSSGSALCCVVSIQEGDCPPSDQLRGIGSRGYVMTMRSDASLSMRREDFSTNRLFVVIIGVAGELCDVSTEYSSNETAENYSKNVSVLVTRSFSPNQYWRGIAFSVFVFLFPYILIGCYFIFELSLRRFFPSKSNYLFFSIGLPSFPKDLPSNSVNLETNIGSTSDELALASPTVNTNKEPVIIAKYRRKQDMYLYIDHQLHLPTQYTKHPSQLRKKYDSYFHFILVLFVFYGMPALQIAFDQLDQLVTTRNQDLCYYNFRCERRISSIRAFNNILSNGAYVTYGILFLIIAGTRHVFYKCHKNKLPHEEAHGIPYFFGVYYSMGVALIAEGVMSALYHTCPTRANYQFDISFMFIMLTLIMVRLYQQRHPDGNVKAVTTFLLISSAIALSTIGLWHGETYFYVIRAIYVLLVFLFSLIVVASLYYFGMPMMFVVSFYDICLKRRRVDFKKLLLAVSHNRSRFLQIGCFLFANILILGLMFSRSAIPDFPSVILYSFIFNFALFFLYYWVMKFVKKEYKHRPHVFTASFLLFIFSIICWIFALSFYFNKVKQWRESASASRERNVECILFNFYDFHDVWHFFSALALFSMYLSILVIDDNIIFVKREMIDIF